MFKIGLLLKWSVALLLVGGVVTGALEFTNPNSVISHIIKTPTLAGIDVYGNCNVDVGYMDHTTDEEGVRLYRRELSQGGFNIVRVMGPHIGVAADFKDENVPPGTYEYQVSVYNANYGELFSNTSEQAVVGSECIANGPLTIKPINPIIVSLNVVNNCRIHITYNDNSQDEDGIRIYRQELGVTAEAVIANLPPHTGLQAVYDDSILPPSTYEYRVSVYNVNGESFSDPKQIEISDITCSLLLDPNSKLPLLVPTPTVSIPKDACIWTPIVNVFLRKGPDVGIFSRMLDVEAGKSFSIIGQSEDGKFWAVSVGPDVVGYITKSEKYSSTSGDCSDVPTLTDPAPPEVESAPTKKPGNGGSDDSANATECPVDPTGAVVCPP